MHDDCLVNLACAIIDLAREDYLTPLPNAAGTTHQKYCADVDSYLRKRNSARSFFGSAWFSVLSLNTLSKEEVFSRLDEKVVKLNVNNCRIGK